MSIERATCLPATPTRVEYVDAFAVTNACSINDRMATGMRSRGPKASLNIPLPDAYTRYWERSVLIQRHGQYYELVAI
jgi:hypothetical protein